LVKVKDWDARTLAESSKGTREVKVKPGKTYLYILTDSGQQLGSVTVKGKR
jgi:hypothetical protein